MSKTTNFLYILMCVKDTYNYPEKLRQVHLIVLPGILVIFFVYGKFLQFQQVIDISVVVYMYLLKI